MQQPLQRWFPTPDIDGVTAGVEAAPHWQSTRAGGALAGASIATDGPGDEPNP